MTHKRMSGEAMAEVDADLQAVAAVIASRLCLRLALTLQWMEVARDQVALRLRQTVPRRARSKQDLGGRRCLEIHLAPRRPR